MIVTKIVPMDQLQTKTNLNIVDLSIQAMLPVVAILTATLQNSMSSQAHQDDFQDWYDYLLLTLLSIEQERTKKDIINLKFIFFFIN